MLKRHGWLLLPLSCVSCHFLQPPVETRPVAEAAAPVRDSLQLAADSLDCGNLDDACGYLADHLKDHPQHTVVRARYAEVLVRLERWPAARDAFEQVVGEDQEMGPAAARHLIHCHRRLMEIAAACEDDYG